MKRLLAVLCVASGRVAATGGWRSAAVGGMPSHVLCEAQVLAYQFAAKLMPERGTAGLAPVAEGLDVDPANMNCSPSPSPGPSPSPSPTPKPPCPKGTCSSLMPGMSLVYVRTTIYCNARFRRHEIHEHDRDLL